MVLAAAGWVLGDLDAGFKSPPREARLRAYWWWLNGNVTSQAITRDLEGMAARGFGGALICDAGGAEQDGNDRVPHGPDFMSEKWRELYRHALKEADRLGLEMSLNIQSGWNLGGPMVRPEEAAKKLVWSEERFSGPANVQARLAEPKHPPAFYRDVFVVAYPVMRLANGIAVRIDASSARTEFPAELAADGKPETFWVSSGVEPGEGPTARRPEWLEVSLETPLVVTGCLIVGRPGYGPKSGEIQLSEDGKSWRTVKAFSGKDGQENAIPFDPARAARWRVLVTAAYDPRFADAPRNVQIAEIRLIGEQGRVLTAGGGRRPIQDWDKKAMHKPLSFSAPDTSLLLRDVPAEEGEQDTLAAAVVDLTAKMAADGTLNWDVPAGEWEVLRFGATLNDHCRVSTCSEGWQGYAIDPFDADAFRSYWRQVVEPLIADAGPLAGTTLKYLHTDSWEVEVANWTPTLREEFRKRRGYDLLPYLPVIAGRIVESRAASNRYLNDFRRTMGDLAIDNHYRLFKQGASRHGLKIHPESGGPHAVPIDAQQCLGFNDVPMSEFWARSWRHRVGDSNRFFVKQPASAAHAYGRRLVAAEGFTTIGPHWQETIWDNLKPAFDQAACEGLNLLFWHAFTCSPPEMGLPGQEYFAGTHFNPNSTWWSRSGPFLAYINRCQYMLQQGLFVADACYYYGDHVPNFAQLKASDPARVLPGYDYDVVTEEVILTRMSVNDGRIVLPDGMSYRVMVLADRPNISLAALRRIRELVAAGATVIGTRPRYATGLSDYPACDQEVGKIAAELWTAPGGRYGNGRVIEGRTAREVLLADGIRPDFEHAGRADTVLDFIHRRDGEAEIYFVANRSNRVEEVDCVFRVAGKRPEFWDPMTGEIRSAAAWTVADGRTTVPMEFAPYGSMFVVFRAATKATAGQAGRNCPRFLPVATVQGAWTVSFDTRWGGPALADFPELVSWTKRPEEGIRFYSGTATYSRSFDLPTGIEPDGRRIMLDLGDVRNLTEVRLNGKNLGVLWAMPFRVDVTEAVKPTKNQIEIDVVNFWPNRVIGDQYLPVERRLTRTNIRKLTKQTPLMESGLLGPVTIGVAE